MANIVIREILASDTFSEQVNKINYNFDQLLLAGGGPPGLIGINGDLGPIGLTGTRTFTVIDIVDRITGNVVASPFLNPNQYYPVTVGSTYKIGADNKPLRNNDLFIEEGDDSPGTDGDIWIYSSITNNWTQTGNNIKGNTGNTGSSGLSEWERVTIGTSVNHDYLTITPQTGSTKYGVILGTVDVLTEGVTINNEAVLTIVNDGTPGTGESIGISLGERGQDADKYSQFNVLSGILQITAPTYGTTKRMILTAENSITLTNSSGKYYDNNSLETIGARIAEGSHYFNGAPLNVYMRNSDILGSVAIYRQDKSGLIIQPSGVSSVVLSAKKFSSNNSVNIDKGNANLALNVQSGKTVVIGAYTGVSADIDFKSTLHVNGNATFGTIYESIDPGNNNVLIGGKLGIGTGFSGNDLNVSTTNPDYSALVVQDNGTYSNDFTSILVKSNNDKLAGLALRGNSTGTDNRAYIAYNVLKDVFTLNTTGNQFALSVNTYGNIGINTQYWYADKQLTVKGDVRLLADSLFSSDSLEIMLDTENITDSLRPTKRGIILSEDQVGLFNFYINTLQNNTYNQSTDMTPGFNGVNSSRFNFRSHNSSNTYPLLSISGIDESKVAIQIGTEYNLNSSRSLAADSERDNFNNTSIHVRKNVVPGGDNGEMTGILFQNDSENYITGDESTDIDFFFTDSRNKLNILNYPQARIRTYTDAISGDTNARMSGRMEFYTAKTTGIGGMGNNELLRAMFIGSNQAVIIDNKLGVNTETFSYTPSTPNTAYHDETSGEIWTELNAGVSRLAVNGSISCEAIWTTSDKRVKTNFEKIVKPLDRVLKLNPILFNYKDNLGIPTGGFIAQEVEEFIPEAIRIYKDDDFEGGKYSLDYDTILTFTVAAVQEQQKQIEEKDKKIVKLEERLAAIEKHLNL
jgi:hypothetical protein